MKSKKQKVNSEEYKYIETKGITLISLIITIIVLIILAGIGINLSLGENGIFNREKYINAQTSEEEQLKELYKELGLLGELPENTPETEEGTIVKTPNKRESSIPAYVSTQTGEEVVSSKKVSTVYAVSIGEGKSVPIPIGFTLPSVELNVKGDVFIIVC